MMLDLYNESNGLKINRHKQNKTNAPHSPIQFTAAEDVVGCCPAVSSVSFFPLVIKFSFVGIIDLKHSFVYISSPMLLRTMIIAERAVEIRAMRLKSSSLLQKKNISISIPVNLKPATNYIEVLSLLEETQPTAPVATQNMPIQIPEPRRLGTNA
jgi:hypothetical protein